MKPKKVGGPSVETHMAQAFARESDSHDSPLKGKRTQPNFNPSYAILILLAKSQAKELNNQPILTKKDYPDAQQYECSMKRCQNVKETEDIRLRIVNKWSMVGKGGNKLISSIAQCPRCQHKFRVFLGFEHVGGSEK